jgi:cyclic beta-1,2-glucan synthetase
VHGLPLIGCGDWNDGMNLVGAKGKGESIWLGFFLYHVLQRYADLAQRQHDPKFAELCTLQAAQLQQNIELHGWDHNWYRRAYFDDGAPLGSAANEECQIDSIAQSWAVLSGAANRSRAQMAMGHLDQRLVRRDSRLIQIFDPPFDKSALEPGYIKGYPPGVRENGGQYTHAAIWAAMAFAELGETERAWELWSLLNPIHRATDETQASRYRVEPYVVAADIYACPPHTGRGGWTWYTGSAGWLYRLVVESLLGVHVEVDRLRLTPRLPRDWGSFKLHYRYRDTFYHITVSRADLGVTHTGRVIVDGKEQPDDTIQLVDDRRKHDVEMKVV